MNTTRRALLLLSPPALYIFALFIIPLGIMILLSFAEGSFGAARGRFTLEHYAAFLEAAAYHRLLLRSGLIAFWTAFFSVLLAYPLAYFLVFKAGKRRVMLLTLLIIPAWTSYLLRILAWKIILGTNGVLSSAFALLGWVDETAPLLLYNDRAVLMTLVYVWIPFAVLPIFAALERVDRRLLEASEDLGSPNWETFLRVTLPLSMPGVTASFFFVFIPTIGEWVTPALVGGAQGVMYGNLIQDQFVRALNWPMGSLMSLVLVGVVLIFMYLFTRIGRVTDMVG